MDEKRIREALLLLGGTAAILFFVWRGNFWVGLFPLALLVGVFLLERISRLVYLTIFSIFSRLFLGDMVGGQPVWLLLEIALLGAIVLRTVLKKITFKKMEPIHKCAAVLIAVLLFTAWRTGFGLYFFGMGSTEYIGGMIYIRCFLNLLLFILLTRIEIDLDPKKMIFSMLAGSFCLFAMECSVIFLHQYWVAGWFEQITSDLSIRGIDALSHGATLLMARFRSAFFVAWGLGFFLFKNKGLKFFLILMVMVLLSALSGYRSDFIATIGFVTVCYYFITRNATRFWVGLSATAALGLVVLYLTLPILPQSVQRTGASLFPHRVSALVSSETEGSTDSRIKIYKYTLSQLPHYFLQGRGLTTTLEEKLVQLQKKDIMDPVFAFEVRGYHLGVFNILIDGGLPFTLALMVFLAMMLRRFLAAQRAGCSREATYAGIWFFCYMFYLCFLGEAPFQRMSIWMMAATILYLALEKQPRDEPLEMASQPDRDTAVSGRGPTRVKCDV